MIVRQELYGRELWLWPDDDTHLIRALKEGPNDTEAAVRVIEPILQGTALAVQAGGGMGVWPRRLAEVFGEVRTFEAHPVNFRCLRHNVADLENVVSEHGALTNHRDGVAVVSPEANNGGAHQVVRGAGIPSFTIDSLNLPACDLIYLDIEGSELDALLGAALTVAQFSPVIGYEHKFDHGGAVRKLLESWGYHEAGRPSSLDVVMAR